MSDVALTKATVRTRLLAARRHRGATDGSELARRVLELLDAPGSTVCAYVARAGEPPTAELLNRLLAGGHRVLLPVLLDDLDLDWAELTPSTTLLPGRLGVMEPEGPRMGRDAVAGADLVVCPGLAADRHGTRLGRGGGSYDRVLARTPGQRVLLLHDEEILESVPAQPHDQRVDVIVTPARTVVCR
jgi:5-formyltetrahydrofolate cyclo-ligase